ncbi:MAG: hypothetical protein HZA54_10925, partial [Planctomycetes bacterium]|nr:hypothetical protein [Planctomycetota bacterium]
LNTYLLVAAGWLGGGVGHLSAQILTWGAIALGATLLVQLARGYTNCLMLSLLPAAIYGGYLGYNFFSYNHHWFGSTATIVFLASMGRQRRRPGAGSAFLSGVAAAVSLLFLLTEGMVNLAAGAGAALATAPAGGGEGTRGRAAWRGLWGYAAGVAVVLGLALAAESRLGALGPFLYDTFVWPFVGYAAGGGVNAIAWGVINGFGWIFDDGAFGRPLFVISCGASYLICVAPFFLLAAAGAHLAAADTTPPALGGRGYGLVLLGHALGVYAAGLCGQGALLKLTWAALPAFLLAVPVLDQVWTRAQGDAVLRRGLGAWGVLVGGSLLLLVGFRAVEAVRTGRPPGIAEFSHPWVSPTADLVNSESGPGDHFFAHSLGSHLYFLVHARPATRHRLTAKGYLTVEQWQEVFADLLRGEPKFMAFRGVQEMQEFAAGDGRLQALLARRYRGKAMPDGWYLLRRMD